MPVQTKNELLELLRRHDETIREFGVKRLGIFGSFVRDAGEEESDVDLLVEFYPDEKTYDNFLNLSEFLEDILGRSVELVTTESLSPHIGPAILREVEYVSAGD
jgi:hypothetical protein